MHYVLIFLNIVLVFGCARTEDVEKTRHELMNVERTFSATSVEKGFYKALRLYKADETMFLKDRPVTDTSEINQMLSRTFPGTVTWEPLFCDVSASGDMGYTYGPATFEVKDSTGNRKVLTSYYLTIWKKQPDGQWKYVMDTGTQPKPSESNK